jgi:glycosyltransferase involved in cell wall biosynthesis
MRICMIAYTFYENDNRVMRYAETLTQRGDHVDIIALRRKGQSRHEVISDVHVFRIQRRTKSERRRISYLFKLLFFLAHSMVFVSRRHLGNPYQVVHVHSVPDFLIFAAWLPKLTHAKLILDIHDVLPEFYLSKFNSRHNSVLFRLLVWIERQSAHFADHVIIANALWLDRLVSRGSVNRRHCSAILNAPDPSIFTPRGRTRADGKFVVIYPGSLNWHQGLDLAISAFSQVRRTVPHAELHIYGEGDQKLALQHTVSELGLNDSVLFKGVCSIRDVATQIENADLGIVPKRANTFGNEAFSTKILEFMQLGIPVVVADTKVDRFYFNDSVVQFFKSGDIEDLAHSIVTLAREDKRRLAMRRNASEFVKQMTWNIHKHEYLRIIDSISNSAGSCYDTPVDPYGSSGGEDSLGRNSYH